MGASGYFDRTLKRAFFWEQSASLYTGERIWSDFRRRGGRVAQICLQQCPGIDSDVYLSPAPVHKHHGGMIQDFLCEPSGLYREICRETGSKFNLMDYWGPFTSIHCSEWIARAAERVMDRFEKERNAFVLAYIPHLDYAPQKYGVSSKQARKAFAEFETIISDMRADAKKHSFDFVLTGDYAMTDVKMSVAPNLILAEAGLLKTREVDGMLYLNLHSSKAFALADHQICHIYLLDGSLPADDVKRLFSGVAGIDRIFDRAGSEFDNPRSGEIILEASPNAWFEYRYWRDSASAPDFARHVDIHSKPGFDPLEMYLELWPPMSTSVDPSRLGASHGRASHVMLASDIQLEAASFNALSREIKALLSK